MPDPVPPVPPVAPPSPAPPTPKKTEVVALQGGPLHGRIMRVDADHQEIELDLGGKTGTAKYKRSPLERPDGVCFNYMDPPKP